MSERLNSSDYRFIAICLLLLTATVWFSARNFYRAFPEASIDFTVNRNDAQTLAGKFLSGQGYDVSGYRDAAQFDFDDEAKTFLEREAGLEQANQLMGTRIRMWRWNRRWFKPLQKEEFRVEITARGELAGFEHELAEDTARPDVPGEQARALAELFLRTRLGRDLAALDFVEEADVTRPHRVDRTFTWKERDFELHNATYRHSVTVRGNEVASYREFLKVPEQWKRDYQRLRSKNEVTQEVDSSLMVLLMIGLVVVIVLRVRRHDVRWRRAALVGMAGIVLGFLAQLNEFPLHEFGYPTTDSYGSFLSRQFLNALLSALGTGGFLFILAAGAEPLYREFFPNKISLGGLMAMRGLRTKRFFLGTILGITLTGIFIAYQTGFYIVAYRFGAWSPADVPYTELLNTKFPWAFVLFGGFFPAVFEEFAFRMFAIPFFRKLTRSMAVALVLAGFLWGFGHSSYPQQPFYIRGVEVGIGGVALGLIMLRFGILPTLVWHYSVDAMYSAMLLVRSQSLYFKLSGAAAAGIMVLPVVVALVAYLRKGGFEPETGLLNRDDATPGVEPAPEQAAQEAPAPQTVPYQPLAARARWAALLLLLAGLASLAIPVAHFGGKPRYQIGPDKARASAGAFLLENGFDVGAFQHVTYPAVHWENADELAGKYFLERRPLSQASALFEKNRPVQFWITRYFKPLDEEEARVSIHPETARAMAFRRTIPEDRPGADIPLDSARDLAARFAGSHGWDVSAMDLKENSSEKKKARRDYSFEWEARAGDPRNVDETRYRVAVEVSGDRVTGARGFWKTPEAFDRSRERSNAISISAALARIAVIAGLIVYALWILVQGTRQGIVRWKDALKLALPAGVLVPIAPLLSMGERYKDYATARPLETFQVELFLQIMMATLGGILVLVIAAALIVSFYPRALEEWRRGNRRVLGLDAALAVFAAAGMELLYRQLHGWLNGYFHRQALLSIPGPAFLGSAVPALAALSESATSVITDAAFLSLLVLLIFQIKRRWQLVVGVPAALCCLVSADVRTPGEFALEYFAAIAVVAMAVAFCRWFGRKNYLAYALVFWLMALAHPVAELIGSGNPSLAAQGGIVAAVAVLVAIWAVAPGLFGAKTPSAELG